MLRVEMIVKTPVQDWSKDQLKFQTVSIASLRESFKKKYLHYFQLKTNQTSDGDDRDASQNLFYLSCRFLKR